MNPWIRRSIELAENSDYLDQLASIYELPTGVLRRPLPPTDRVEVDRLLNEQDFVGLIRLSLRLECFPFQEPYVGSFRADIAAIDRNPRTVRRIAETLRGMRREDIIEGLEKPKQINRMLGNLFRRFVIRLPFPKLQANEFITSEGISILTGGDAALKDFCNCTLGCNLPKGPDLVAKTPAGYVIGEAKFITTKGGNQDKSFREVIESFLPSAEGTALRIGVLDGVVWLEHGGLYGTIRAVEHHVLSALVLQEFLESLAQIA